MRVEGCTLADTKGARVCPSCGERHLQKIHSLDCGGRPVKVECPACRHVWTWPTVAEDEARRKEDMRRRSHENYIKHRDEIRERERKYRGLITAKARERRHKNRAHLHPTKTCPVCGTKFVALHGGHKYCSAHCCNSSPDRKRTNGRQKERDKRRKTAYLQALEAVAESVGRLDECRRIRDEVDA